MSDNVPALFGDAQEYIDDPRFMMMFDMIAGDFAREVADIVNEALAADTAGDGMLCLGDAVRAVNRVVAERPDLLGELPAGETHWPRLSMRQIQRLAQDPDFSQLLLIARIEANWKLNGADIQEMVSATGTIDQRIRWFGKMQDEAYRADGRALDRAKLALARARDRSIAHAAQLDTDRQPRVPGMRLLTYVDDDGAETATA